MSDADLYRIVPCDYDIFREEMAAVGLTVLEGAVITASLSIRIWSRARFQQVVQWLLEGGRITKITADRRSVDLDQVTTASVYDAREIRAHGDAAVINASGNVVMVVKLTRAGLVGLEQDNLEDMRLMRMNPYGLEIETEDDDEMVG